MFHHLIDKTITNAALQNPLQQRFPAAVRLTPMARYISDFAYARFLGLRGLFFPIAVGIVCAHTPVVTPLSHRSFCSWPDQANGNIGFAIHKVTASYFRLSFNQRVISINLTLVF